MLKLLMVKGFSKKDSKEYYGIKAIHTYSSGKKYTSIVDFIDKEDYEKAKSQYGVDKDGNVVILND